MRRCLKNKELWALIFWPETIESSVISVKDVTEAVKPEFIKIGWKGDLPWVDENGITTLYEATIKKISHHRSYLLSIDIDCFGKIIKETQPEHIMKEKNSITKLKKESTKLKNKQKAKVQQSLINITEIGKTSKTEKQKSHNDDVVKNRVTDDKNSPKKNQKEDYSGVDDNFPNKSLSEGPKEHMLHMQCSNCTDCFCKSWRKLITPQIMTVFGKMVQSMNKFLLKDPEYGMKKDKNELYPNTNIFLTQEDIDNCIAKANCSIPGLVRQLLMKILTPQELVECGTAEGMNKKNKNIRTAILGYLKHERNIEMTVPEFNEILKKKIYYCRNEIKSMEEKIEINELNRKRVQENRKKRKTLEKENNGQLKKVKGQEIDLPEEEKIDKSEEEEVDDIQLEKPQELSKEPQPQNHISLDEAHEEQEPSKQSQQGDEHHNPQRINQQQPELSRNIQQNIHSQEMRQQQPQQSRNRQDQFSQYPYSPQQFYYQPPPHYPPINYQQSQHQPIPYPHQNSAWSSNCPPTSYAHQQFPPSYTYDNNFQQHPINNVTQPDTNLQPL